MEDFGERLTAIRGKLTRPDVAARALGPDSTKDQRRDFANYLARVERENGNVSLQQLRLFAKGLGYATLSAFWIAMEQAFAPTHARPAKNYLPSVRERADTAALPLGADYHATALPVHLADLERVVYGAVEEITGALERLGDRVATRGPADATRGTAAARRRASARTRARKTA